MQIYIDESGSFSFHQPVSVLGSLMFPESAEYKLKKFFSKLYPTLATTEKDANGEMKGRLVSDKTLETIFSFLADNRDFKITFEVLDLDTCTQDDWDAFREGQAGKIQECLDIYMQGPVKSPEMKAQLEQYRDWTRSKKKISDNDFIEVILLVDLLERTFQKAIVYFSNKKYAPAFNDIFFHFDAKSSKKMNKYINDMMYIYLESVRSGRPPIVGIAGTVFPGHPLEKYEKRMPDGRSCYDLHGIYKNGVTFSDSKDHLGLQLIDVIVSGVYGIVTGKRPKELFNLIRFASANFKDGWTPLILRTFSKSSSHSTPRNPTYAFMAQPPKKCWSRILPSPKSY